MSSDNVNGNVNYLICRGMVLKEIMYSKRAVEKFGNQDYATGYISALSAIEGFLAGLPAVGIPKWISVEERLPEYGRYLVITQKDNGWPRAHTATFNHLGWWTHGNFGEITHWMPLPELPEEERQ